MLKIKNNVDVKELEKFGFKKRIEKSTNQERYVFYVRLVIKISIDVNTRIIKICNHNKAYDVLFDLIQANLVEKIE